MKDVKTAGEITPSLIELARRSDRLDPEKDWQKRLDLGEELKQQLGPHYAAFERFHDALCAPVPMQLFGKKHLAETALRMLVALQEASAPATEAPPLRDVAPEATEAAGAQEPPLTEEERLTQAIAAYRRFRTLSQQAQAKEQELASASLAWTTARDALAQNTPARARLHAATEKIDAEIVRARRRPALHQHQLPGSIPAPRGGER